MAEMNEIYTRIQLKYDSYANWDAVKNTFKPLPGEVCIVEVPSGNTAATTAPTVLFKVGQAKSTTENYTFAELPWASGLAADVYAWAKKATPDWSDFPALPLEIEDPDGEAAMLYPILDITYADNKLVITRGKVGAFAIDGLADVKIKNAEHADTATTATTAATADVATRAFSADVAAQASSASKVDNALTIKVGGADVVFDGSAAQEADIDSAIAAAEQRAKDYTDTKPHVNTAHTHSAGAGLVLSDGNGGITGNVKYELNVAFELVDKKIKLYDKTDSTKTAIAELDATQFITDGMLASVTADQVNNKLVFEWNTDAGTTKTEVELSSIADIYTGVTNTETITTVKNTNEIEVTLVNDGVIEAKLEKNIRDALALARTALQEHQDISGKKDKQAAKTFTGSTVKTVTSVKQDENGEITEVKFEDIGKIANAEHADVATKVQTTETAGDSITIQNGNITLNNASAADAHINAREISISTGSALDETAVLRVGGIDETGTNAKYSTLTKDTLTTNNVVADKATIGGVTIEPNTSTDGIKYLVFNCGTATKLI